MSACVYVNVWVGWWVKRKSFGKNKNVILKND